MKLLTRLFTIALFLGSIYFILQNGGGTTLYKALFFAAGLVCGAGFVWQSFIAAQDKIKAYKRELEKNSVVKDSSTSRVEVLEAKIKVLEKALQDVLNK